jgi:hypothetical protein
LPPVSKPFVKIFEVGETELVGPQVVGLAMICLLSRIRLVRLPMMQGYAGWRLQRRRARFHEDVPSAILPCMR